MSLSKITKAGANYKSKVDVVPILSREHNLVVDQVNSNETDIATNAAAILLKQPGLVEVTTIAAATGTTTVAGELNVVLVDYTTTGASTVTLGTATVAEGQVVIIKDVDGNAATNNITVDTEGSETIDGAASASITADSGALRLVSDGTDWFTI